MKQKKREKPMKPSWSFEKINKKIKKILNFQQQ